MNKLVFQVYLDPDDDYSVIEFDTLAAARLYKTTLAAARSEGMDEEGFATEFDRIVIMLVRIVDNNDSTCYN